MNPESPFQPQQGPAQVVQPNQSFSPDGQSLPQQAQPIPAQLPQPNSSSQPQAPSQYPQPGISNSSQKKHRPWVLIGLLVFFILAFMGSSVFAFLTFAKMQDYKNNVDEKVAVAVSEAVKTTEETKEKEFLERSKSPYKKYKSPATFGAIEITYPKTWSASVDEHGGSVLVNGYFHPDYVPGPKSGTAFALRVEVLEQPYDKVLGTYDSEAKKGSIKVSPYKADRVPSVLGARLDGEIEKGLKGSAVILPLRDKTIRISTQSYESFGNDFDKTILSNLIFTP